MGTENLSSMQTQSQAIISLKLKEIELNASIPKDARVVKLFKMRLNNIGYVFRNGKRAPFLAGRYSTDIPSEIAELEEEIELGHPHLYISADDPVLPAVETIESLRKKHFEEFELQMKRAMDKNNNAGNTVQERLNAVNSNTIASGAGTSDSMGTIDPAAPVPGIKINLKPH